MKNRFVSIFLCASIIASLAFSGCGAKDTEKTGTADKSSKKGPVTVTFGIEKTNENLIKEFEAANPDIKIQYVDTGAETEKLMAMLAANTAPDLIRVTGVTAIPSYVTKGIALNLDSYFAKSQVFKADDLLPICDVYKFDGKKSGKGSIYGLPKDWSQDTGIIINKKVFQQAGVPIPSDTTPMTYTEYFKLGEKLRKLDAKGNVIQMGLDQEAFNCGEAVHYKTLLYQLESLGVSLFSEDMKKSKFTDPKVKKVIAEWIDAKKAKVTGSPLIDNTGFAGLADDKLGVENWGYWITGQYRGDDKTKNRLDTDFMLLPSPYPEGGKPAAACTFATGGIIYSKSQHKDEAWKVFEWYFGGKPAEDRAKSGWGLPVLKHLMTLVPQSTAFDKQALKVVNAEIERLITITVNPYASNLQPVINKELTPVLVGKIDLDTGLKNLEKAVDTMIQEGMEVAGVK